MAEFQTRENRAFAYEIKFLVPEDQALAVRTLARQCMQPDPNTAGGSGDVYRITSLYYDTCGFDVFHKRGSFGRCKYRVRRYDSSPTIFLERKLRTHGIVTKRRTLVDLEELELLREVEAERSWSGNWFHRRMLARAMNPSCQISYSRTALVAENGGGLFRLTLDDDVRAWRVRQPEYVPLNGGVPLLKNQTILEMKFRIAMPALFKQILEENRLSAQPVSKYSMAVTALGCAAPAAPLATTLPQTEAAYV